jgi:alkylation response protein AidB-like acyl-CoA dehydrogenase
MFTEAVEAILIDACTPAAVRAIEGGSSPLALSSRIEDAGFHALLLPESQGGAGASWGDFHSIVALCGAYAVPLPLAQTLAAHALVHEAASLPAGPITFAPALVRQGDGSLYAPLVPFGRTAAHVVAADGETLLLLAAADARVEASGVHGSLTASLSWQREGLRLHGDAGRLQPLGALLHAAMMAGAMKRVLAMTMRYANERVQFGKSIGKFQAIQQQLSVMAEHVVAASMAAQAAFAASTGSVPAWAACAVAKARTSEAAQVVASIAHGVHGAIGVTEEYDLQLYTRRLHEWRMAHGSEAYWHEQLGLACIAASGESRISDFARSVFA